ncbi:MAG: acetyl-CoA hydrolase/transferase C-terminal domain-containing protein [Pseudomonadales bacterium]|nr:acetyl-CoA hydrolase/transferase C-terminal domain-containing protein [Pseudomonadales bacterium]MDP6471907.1 acetyl-CoA hydrolase/transferase C-terminal domain-containing protein [Pseudomonadales bacterium]MDP6826823.1 acetyl-CoA hydrolase/transferase C-terminal domain-containing protein [Pseudomonadales bacterium]MDP6970899.1 acetyl-CoA hydrolase/transferase C-terminal domain-containing protein [Pseudomonadales bacterium]
MDLSVFDAGQRIYVAGSSNEPSTLLAMLAEAASRGSLPRDLHFVQFPLGRFNRCDFTAWHDSYQMTTVFMTPHLRGAAAGRLHFVPMQMRSVYDYLSRGIDIALLQVARDRDGVLRLGPNADFTGAILDSDALIVVELNEGIVAPAGCPAIDEARIAQLCTSQRPLHSTEPPEIDEAAAVIGALVADLIEDGDCVQTGIGMIPAAILKSLEAKNDLGMHGGLIDDGGMELIRRGVITGAMKAVDRGLHITGMALGTQRLYDWLADRGDVVFRGANHTHEVGVIRQLDNFVSVNSAVEVDLMGQINAEVAGGRQISGTGGSVDFMRGAKASRGGRSIVALNATARGGEVSRIVPRVCVVTALRTDVDIVVTEYGVASLKHLPLEGRAQALTEIAAPRFRDELKGMVA